MLTQLLLQGTTLIADSLFYFYFIFIFSSDLIIWY